MIGRIRQWRAYGRRWRDVRALAREGETVESNYGPLFVHSRDQIITPVLRAEHRMPDVDIETLDTLELRGTPALDVGANIGYTALQLAGLLGAEGRVIAIEPHPGQSAASTREPVPQPGVQR